MFETEDRMAAHPRVVIEGLREKIRRIEGRTPLRTAIVASGWARVDTMLPGGGFPRGALSELTGGRASGKTALALSTLVQAMSDQGFAAFVDGQHELYPPAAVALGIDLERLLVIRPAGPTPAEAARRALWAAETILASGAFEAVAIDVALDAIRPQHGAEVMLRRLRAAAEKGGAAALWLSAASAVRIPSAVRLELSDHAEGRRVRRIDVRGIGGLATAVKVHHHAA